MVQVTDAIYAHGVLRPKGDLALREAQRVRLIVEPLDDDTGRADRSTALRRLREGIEGMKFFSSARTGGQDAGNYFERTPSDGIYLLARFRGRPSTRFRLKGCVDAKSDGVAIRRADGAFCRNRYNVARGA